MNLRHVWRHTVLQRTPRGRNVGCVICSLLAMLRGMVLRTKTGLIILENTLFHTPRLDREFWILAAISPLESLEHPNILKNSCLSPHLCAASKAKRRLQTDELRHINWCFDDFIYQVSCKLIRLSIFKKIDDRFHTQMSSIFGNIVNLD